MSNKIKVVYVEPGERAKITEIDSSLEGLQEAVGGGVIQAIYPFKEEVCCACNDDGKLDGLPLNRALRKDGSGKIYDIIAGPFFICDCSGESFASLTDEQAEKYQKMFELPEMFFSIDGQIIVRPYEPEENDLDSMIENASVKFEEAGRDDGGIGGFER